MSGTIEPFSFVHTSDWHLEQPVGGLSEVPDGWYERLLDAPYAAAERVVDTTLQSNADFLILAGDILQVKLAGPHAVDFLRQQLERLAAAQIPVYWVSGRVDLPEDWPSTIPLPSNVQRLGHGEPIPRPIMRDTTPLATIEGATLAANDSLRSDLFPIRERHLYRIVTVHGSADLSSLPRDDLEYWALGGRHHFKKSRRHGCLAVTCGSPQSRQPAEVGPHGCATVRVAADGSTDVQHVATDILRWQSVSVEVHSATTRSDFEHRLREHAQRLLVEAGGCSVLAQWSIVDAGCRPDSPGARLLAQMRCGRLAADLCQDLQRAFGHLEPGLWSAELDVVPSAQPAPSWQGEDSVLGEFLRGVQIGQDQLDRPLVAEQWLTDHGDLAQIPTSMRVHNASDRQRILHQVAALGADLLQGHYQELET